MIIINSLFIILKEIVKGLLKVGKDTSECGERGCSCYNQKGTYGRNSVAPTKSF